LLIPGPPLERSLFDLSFVKIAVLAVIALVVFGPDQLPKMAAQAGRALRDVRRMAENARADLQQHLPDELQDFDVADLNPKHFVRKHLLDEFNGLGATGAESAVASGTAGLAATATATATAEAALLPGEHPPYDDEAT
jgi:sec-independent protein translocase protein TatB